MKRSHLLGQAAALGLLAAAPPRAVQASAARGGVPISPLAPPHGGVNVAFLISDGTVMIDFAGPWEVFQDANVLGRSSPAFNLYSVAESIKPVAFSGGATVVPQHTLGDAPAPNVVVVPAQADPTPAIKQWLVATARRADVVMSVCTGALVLAQAGLLDGKTVTTHHSAFGTLPMTYPSVKVERGVRFVDNGRIATSAGLSAGIDLALHVVARYYGTTAAKLTAYDMEYQSTHWLDAGNEVYAKAPVAQAGYAFCQVCWMQVDPKSSPVTSYRGKKYYFCMPAHERLFVASPERFINA